MKGIGPPAIALQRLESNVRKSEVEQHKPLPTTSRPVAELVNLFNRNTTLARSARTDRARTAEARAIRPAPGQWASCSPKTATSSC